MNLTAEMARKKKKTRSKGSANSPSSFQSEQSQAISDLSNPTNGGCSGNMERASVKAEGKQEKEKKTIGVKEEKDDDKAMFASSLDLPPIPVVERQGMKKEEDNKFFACSDDLPLLQRCAREGRNIFESIWKDEERNSKCAQAWAVCTSFQKDILLFLANGEAQIITEEEWVAGQRRAERSLSGSESERRAQLVQLPQSVAKQVPRLSQTLLAICGGRQLPLWPWSLALSGDGSWGDLLWAEMLCMMCGRDRRVSPQAGKEVDEAMRGGYAHCGLLKDVQCGDKIPLTVRCR